MNDLKKHLFVGAGLVSVLGTILHFIYELSGNNPFVGLFVPINESIWEHLKLIFFPMLLFSILSKKQKSSYSSFGSAVNLGTLVGTFLIPVLFYTYSGALGFNTAIIDILIFYVSVAAAFYTIWRFTPTSRIVSYQKPLKLAVLLLGIAFVVFTVFPPNIALFKEP